MEHENKINREGDIKMAKRTVATIKQFDYTSKDEFQKDIDRMKKKGYFLVENGMLNGLTHGEVLDDTWRYTAYFVKTDMM